MKSKIAIIGIIVENLEMSGRVNEILHEFGKYIIGRMGVPHHKRGLSIISVVMDAPTDVSSSLSGKLGMVEGVSVKSLYSKMEFDYEE